MEVKVQALEKDFWITFNNQPNLSERVRQLEDFTEIHRSLIGDLDLHQVDQDSQRENKVKCFTEKLKKIESEQDKLKNTQELIYEWVESLEQKIHEGETK